MLKKYLGKLKELSREKSGRRTRRRHLRKAQRKQYESGGTAERQSGHYAGLSALRAVDHAVRGVGSATNAPSAACLRKCSSTKV